MLRSENVKVKLQLYHQEEAAYLRMKPNERKAHLRERQTSDLIYAPRYKRIDSPGLFRFVKQLFFCFGQFELSFCLFYSPEGLVILPETACSVIPFYYLQ